MSNELVKKIIDKAVRPELQKFLHETIGVVTSYNADTRLANISAYNPWTGGLMDYKNVPLDYLKENMHIVPDPKRGTFVKVVFNNGSPANPVIREIVNQDEMRDYASTAMPFSYGYL